MTVAAVAEVERSQGDEEMKDLGPGGVGIMPHRSIRSSACFPFGLSFRKACVCQWLSPV